MKVDAAAVACAKVSDGSVAVDRVEGRLRDELGRLRAAVEAARAKGAALPEVELRGIRRLGATRAASSEVTPPAVEATPTPTAPR